MNDKVLRINYDLLSLEHKKRMNELFSCEVKCMNCLVFAPDNPVISVDMLASGSQLRRFLSLTSNLYEI